MRFLPVHRAALAAALALATSACTVVPAYQRGRLMQRTMQARPVLDAAFAAHVAELRESAIGANASESASCGCR